MIEIQVQCPKLRFYFVHPQGALLLKLCTRDFLHAPSQYGLMTISSKNVHTPGAHLRKSCTRPRKYARRVHGAPLISDTEVILIFNFEKMVKIHNCKCNRSNGKRKTQVSGTTSSRNVKCESSEEILY